MNESFRTRLLELAKHQTLEESGGRSNDQRDEYECGVSDGYTLLAREILEFYCIKF
jgi:hypothetical protein